MKKYVFGAAIALSFVNSAYAQVPLNCSGSDCGAVQIPPSEGMRPASEAGTAPGAPIEAPSTPNVDPIAPNEPPSPR